MHLLMYIAPSLVSVTGKRGIGIPVILLHDSEGAIVTVELKNGTVYRGVLQDSQDNMNCTIQVTYLDAVNISSTSHKLCSVS
jgi:small nuclear ribonucleoprotein (snRNP)-like protein